MDSKEIYHLTIPQQQYEDNYELFKKLDVIVKRVEVINEDHEGDELHKKLLKAYLKARDELRTYEFNKRHKINKP